MTRRATARALMLGAAMLSAACHSPSASRPDGSAPESPRSYNLITRDEMADASLLGSTAFLAIQRLRPAYLIDKTAGAAASIHPLSVSVNGGQLSPVNSLLSIPVQVIAEIRYLDIGDAAQRFHNRATGPVILVTLSAQPSP